MAFNDSLNFEPSIAKLRDESAPFHVILSGYLRSSKTFELYARLGKREGLPSRLVPFELKGDDSERVRRTLDELLQLLRREPNFRSIMVSDPFKRSLHSLVDEVADRARDCGAINVVVKENNRITGDNFDGAAFVAGAIEQCGVNFEGKKMVFFGCGGVSSAVSARLAGVLDKIGLVDLNLAEAKALAEILKRRNSSIDVEIISAQGDRNFREYDYVYNGTGLGKSDNRSPISPADQFKQHGIAFDANYTPDTTPFLKQLSDRGFRTINGLSHMLMCTSLHLSAVTGESVPYETVKGAYLS
ncbi:MAG: hypothetical protein HYX67_15490 [Candidatus Melainabacteria bacterium]|nr:hypothetical protein [Candidatus Melainabacteria bacterium]